MSNTIKTSTFSNKFKTMASIKTLWFIVLITLTSSQKICEMTDMCSQCPFPSFPVTDRTFVLCDGNRACECAVTITAPFIQCTGNDGCKQAEEIFANVTNVICSGDESCEFAESIVANGTVYCSGYQGCRQANIISANNETRCDGALGCFQANRIVANSGMYVPTYYHK